MADDLRYPALIVMPPNEDYVKRPSGGGGQPQTFADVEETRVKILVEYTRIRALAHAQPSLVNRGEAAPGLVLLSTRPC